MLPLESVKQTDSEPIDHGVWLKLERVKFKDKDGVERSWERCVRTGSRSSSHVDAVDIHAVLKTPEPHQVLVIQYRPAIERYCIEFPSGLVDQGEDPIDAAIRELREETGYLAEKSKVKLHPAPVSYEPGMTSSCCLVAQVTLDMQEFHRNAVAPCLEPDEWSLQTITLPLKGLLKHLTDLVFKHDGRLVIDSRLHAYAAGLAAFEEHMNY